MKQNLALIALIVDDYDEALHYYTSVLKFNLIEDTVMSETKRWVVIAPEGSNGTSLLLAKASTEEQKSRIGNQTGGRVFLFLHTDDLRRDYDFLKSKNVKFVREMIEESWGTVAVFADKYGNLWDLIQPKV
ncbi:MAG: VOC family protein [Bacteroidetes bacterium]|nr:VOC family protein [Bacteroidota bacterium]MBL0063991.1 VOC family protein [Bacteroidota bacterium]MBL0139624.1 VOC family protein [Bacteroidota bacterium]